MTKKSRRRHVQYDKDQLGCMWGFISFLDFRTGRSTQRLLSDRSLNINTAGAGNKLNKFEALVNSDESLQGTHGAEESSAGRPSVKTLIEEEMVSEQGTEMKAASPSLETEPKQSLRKSEDSKKKKQRKNKKASRKNCDSSINESYTAESLESKCSSAHTEGLIDRHKENGIMEEVCTHIYQESVSCSKDEPREVQEELSLTRAEIKERLCEVIRKYINHHVQSKKHLSDSVDNQLSKEIVNALQIPNIDEEIFLKLLQDPNSPLVKYIQGLQEEAHLGEDRISGLQFESNLSEQKHNGPKKSEEIVPYKSHRFLWRSIKSPDTDPSNRNKSNQVPNTIIILKPGLTEQNGSPARSSIDSSPRFSSAEKERQAERGSSHYFLAEIKRRMKNFMGKDQPDVSPKKKFPDGRGQSKYESKGVIWENIGRNSSSKDHFFMEKISRPSVGSEKEEKVSKLRESEGDITSDTASNSSQRISSIYIEAKKHLSEMLSTGDDRVNSSTQERPRTLGRILSLPEYTSPFASPRCDVDHRYTTAQTKIAIDKNVQNCDEHAEKHAEENTNSNIDSSTEKEIKSCTLNNSDEKKQTLDINAKVSEELVLNEKKEDATDASIIEKCSSGCHESLGLTDIIIGEGYSIKEDNADLSSPSSIEFGQDYIQSETLKDGFEGHDFKEGIHDNRSASSPLASPSCSSNMRIPEDIEICIDKPEHASPISVLEPLFVEDDISPARTVSQTVDLSINPLKISFEGEDFQEKKSIFTKTCPNDKAALLEYVKVVIQASGLNCNELFLRSASVDQLLETSLYDEVHFIFQNLRYDPKLLFDCINEVLLEVCGHYFGCCPWVSFVRHKVTATPSMKAILHEVWEGVYWHLLSLTLPHSLEQTIRKDLSKSGTWVDNLCFDTEEIGIELCDDILDDLMDDTLDQLCE